ncbi:MAG: MarR family winged helix-turn-helix transcriptional regulator [Steroidobacteraceae bacterium]
MTDRSRDGVGPASLTAAQLVLAVRALSQALQELFAAGARASGLPLLEFQVLVRAVDGDGVIARDAGRQLRLSTSTMSGLVDRLVRDKLIRRAPHPSDRRLLLLQATPKGRKTVERTLGPLLAQLEATTSGLGSTQRATIGVFLNDLCQLVLEQANVARPRPTRRAVAQAGRDPDRT